MQNSIVTNRCSIESERFDRAFDTLRIHLKATRVPRAYLSRKRHICRILRCSEPLAPFSRTTTLNKSYPCPATHLSRRGTYRARRSYSATAAFYGFPYSARVSPDIVLVTRARGNPGDFYSSIRSQKLVARVAYTEVTTVLRWVPAPHRITPVAPVMYSFLFPLRERDIGYNSYRPRSSVGLHSPVWRCKNLWRDASRARRIQLSLP